MQIVIEISEEDYKLIKSYGKNSTNYRISLNLYDAVKNGTPLPEHHGRLIDADKLIRDTIKNPVHAPYIHIIDMKEAPTIIEGSNSE